MRTLILVRHGKSDWGVDFGRDHERPLAPRGHRAARRIGEFLSAAGLVPDAVLSSTALRASTTAELAKEAGAWPCDVVRSADLYDTTVQGALDVLRGAPDKAETLAVFGHEPTWSGLASALIGGGDLKVVTAAAVGIETPVARWQDLDVARGQLRFMVPPRLLD